MASSTFHNASGLDAEGHLTSARDVALMSRALLSHEAVTGYTSVWMDELRGGKTQLVNTNKLVRFYQGANGLKTGTTSGAGFCLAASATRNGLTLVAVVMGAKSSDERFSAARGLLDYGFAHYASVPPPDLSAQLAPIRVMGGVLQRVELTSDAPSALVIPKGTEDKLETRVEIAQDLKAPVEAGQTVGRVVLMMGEEVLCEFSVKTARAVAKMTPLSAFLMLWREAVCMGRKSG
jgi:D-alanyl-D-alanine carboxypeptidase (penicillin-binding protein 5/6)